MEMPPGLAGNGAMGLALSHHHTTTMSSERPQRTDREPSSARSAFDYTGRLKYTWMPACVRGRCEPRTARGPVMVSKCARLARIFCFLFALFLSPYLALAQRPLGLDVSSYQGTNKINWPSVKSGGVTFAWTKATEGQTVNDGSFAGNE